MFVSDVSDRTNIRGCLCSHEIVELEMKVSNESGKFLAAFSTSYGFGSNNMVEIKAILDGLRFSLAVV